MEPATLFELCAKTLRKHNLEDKVPPVLFERYFKKCCLDLETAYRVGHVECVEKCMSEGSDPWDALRACALYSDVKTALATQHFFPEGCRLRGSLGDEPDHILNSRLTSTHFTKQEICYDTFIYGCGRRVTKLRE